MPWYDANDVIKATNAVPDSEDIANQKYHDLYDKAEEEIKKQDEERARKAAERAAAAAAKAGEERD